jgi:cation:H+ antiporter
VAWLFATRMRLPMAVVGAVVLGFGTSMPELLTSLSAAWAGAPGIAVGNVVGSNIANILLILGIRP